MNNIRVTPYLVLFLAGLLALLLTMTALWVALQQPWLGIQLRALENEQGLEVVTVDSEGPSVNILYAGDVLISIGHINGSQVKLEARDLVEDPDIFPTFDAYNQFLVRQQALSDIIHQPAISITLDGGRVVRIQPRKSRPIAALPVSFWVVLLFGSISLMLGAGLWAVQKTTIAVRFLFGSGIGFLIGTCAAAVYSTRELAMAAETLHILSGINHVGNNLFAICGLGLLWHYPKPIHRFPATLCIATVTAIYLLNEQFQWVAIPGHVFYTLTAGMFVLAICFAVMQWLNTSGDLVKRAALKWFLIAIMISMTSTVLAFFVPAYLYGESLLSVTGSYGVALLMYIGLAFGVHQYRLFDIDRWWFELWLWFFAGISVLAVDIMLNISVQAMSEYSLIIALIAVGWLYFPVRQKLWERFVRRSNVSLEQYLPDLITALLKTGKSDINQQWKMLLCDIFNPLHTRESELTPAKAKIEPYGESMILPTIKGEAGIEILHADRGTRLFSGTDAKLADALLQILQRTKSQIEAQLSGASKERERIMRDLHDDVAGRLLTLSHTSHEANEPNLARDALKSLRDIIYSLEDSEGKSLDEAVACWRAEINERCAMANVELVWNWYELDTRMKLNARQLLNLNRVLYEAGSNALRHADTRRLEISGEVKHAILDIVIQNDGVRPDEKTGQGKGLLNMDTRMHELYGSFSYKQDNQRRTFTIHISMPLT